MLQAAFTIYLCILNVFDVRSIHWHKRILWIGKLGDWEELEHEKVILCISKSYPNRLTSNTNTILFLRFARILSPTFLIAFKAGVQTECTRKCETERESRQAMKKLPSPSKYLHNICRWAAFYTDLPLLMLMWPIRFGSTTISHSILSSSSSSSSSFRCYPIYSDYVWCMRWARSPRAVHRL